MKKKKNKALLAFLTAGLISGNILASSTSAMINNNENLINGEKSDKLFIIQGETGISNIQNTQPVYPIYPISVNLTDNVTRYDAVVTVMDMMRKIADIDNIDSDVSVNANVPENMEFVPFEDIDVNRLRYEDLTAAQKAGLVIGNGMNQFNPDAKLTKRDYAKIVGRMFDILKKYGVEYKLPNPNIEDLKDYSDYNILKGDEENFYSIIMQLGIIEPKIETELKSPELISETHMLDPKGEVTAQEIENLRLIMERIDKTNFTETEITAE